MTETRTTRKPLLVRNGNFRALWLSATVGIFGSAITSIALPIIAAVQLDASNFAVAALAGMTFLPWLLFGLPIGVWVDRLKRKPIIVGSLLLRIVALATLPVTYWLGELTVAHLYVVAFVVGLSAVSFSLADQALVPQAVSKDELVEGNGILTASSASADAAGRGTAGVLTVAVGASNSVLVQVATSVVSIVAISSLKVREPEPEIRPRKILHEMRQGLSYTFGTAPLRALLFNAALWNLGGNIVVSLLVLLIVRVINESEIWLGILMAAASVGGAIGGITVKRVSERIGSGPLWRWSMVPAVIGYSTLLFMTPGTGMIVGIIGLFIMGIAVAWNIVMATSFRQRVCPPEMMGRLGSATRMVSWGMLGIAGFIAGGLAEVIGVRNAVLVGVIVAAMAPLTAIFGKLRNVKRLEDLEPEPAADTGSSASSTPR